MCFRVLICNWIPDPYLQLASLKVLRSGDVSGLTRSLIGTIL